MSVELPKDAEGREIPLDTECLYTYDGDKQNVLSFAYYRRKDRWEIETDTQFINSIHFYITPPDSWEKLEEDMTRAINAPKPYNYDSMTCGYFDNAGSSCQECKKKNGFDSFNCNTVAWKDILSRIRKLRGEDE